MRMRLVFVSTLVSTLLLAPAAHAVITFTQLDEDSFTVSHMVKAIGGRGQAMKKVYEKAASLCVAAGFTHMKVLDQESYAGSDTQNANATVRVNFYFEKADERTSCAATASDDYVRQAREKLAKMGYEPPSKPSADDVEPADDDAELTCTVEQITTMIEIGLTTEQIKAACAEPDSD